MENNWIQLVTSKNKSLFVKVSFIEIVCPMAVKDELQKKEPILGSIVITSDGSKWIVLDHVSDILRWTDAKIINVDSFK